RRRRPAGSAPDASQTFLFERGGRLTLDWNRHDKDGATVRVILGPDPAALGGQQAARDRQSHPGAESLLACVDATIEPRRRAAKWRLSAAFHKYGDAPRAARRPSRKARRRENTGSI